jgi:VWFA-related protein
MNLKGMGSSKVYSVFLFISLLFVLIPAFSLAGAPQKLNEQIKVTYHLTDVKVTDKSGNHVPGLTKDDFILFIDGKPVEIKSIDEVLSESLRSPIIKDYINKLESTPQGVKPPELPVAPRFIIFVFDRGYMGEVSFRQCKELAKRMIRETLLPFDRVALFALNNGVQVLSGPTTDKEKLIAIIDGYRTSRRHDLYFPHQFEINPLRHVAPNIDPNDKQREPMPVNINASTLQGRNSEKEVQSRKYMATFKSLSDVFRNMPEKKSVIFFSDGFSAKNRSDYLTALEHFNSGNTTFFTIRRGPLEPEWAAGLLAEAKRNTFPFVQKVKTKRESTMREIAHNTNGKFIDPVTNDEKLIALLEKEIGNYYFLGFIPPKTSDRKHGIRVEVKEHPDYEVTFRESFTTRKSFKDMNNTERRIHLEEGFLTPGFHRELEMKVMTDFYSSSGKPHLALAVSIPANKISGDERQGYKLELVINIEDAKGQIRRRVHKTFESKDFSGEILKCIEETEVIKEPFAVYLAMRDNISGKRSTWSKVIYPRPEHEKTAKATPSATDSSVDLAQWKVNQIKDGVKVIY